MRFLFFKQKKEIKRGAKFSTSCLIYLRFHIINTDMKKTGHPKNSIQPSDNKKIDINLIAEKLAEIFVAQIEFDHNKVK